MPITKLPNGSYRATYGGQTKIFKSLNRAKEWASKFTIKRNKKSRKMSY